MRFKSSGLGEDKELKGYLYDLSPVGEDLLLFQIQTTEPVQWRLRAGLEFSDIPAILKGILKPSVLPLLLKSLFYIKSNPKEPEQF
jgi:hypothetical protein